MDREVALLAEMDKVKAEASKTVFLPSAHLKSCRRCCALETAPLEADFCDLPPVHIVPKYVAIYPDKIWHVA